MQHAFASGAADGLDERKKWLLARSVVDCHLTLKELQQYTGLKTREGVRQLYRRTLKVVWEALPVESQQQYPRHEVLRGRGDLSPETTARMVSAQGERRRRVMKIKASDNFKPEEPKLIRPNCTKAVKLHHFNAVYFPRRAVRVLFVSRAVSLLSIW